MSPRRVHKRTRRFVIAGRMLIQTLGFVDEKKYPLRIFLIKYRDCFRGGEWYHTLQSSPNEIESFYKTDYFVYLIQTHPNVCYYIFKNIKMILRHYGSLYFTKMSLTHQSQPVVRAPSPYNMCTRVTGRKY